MQPEVPVSKRARLWWLLASALLGALILSLSLWNSRDAASDAKRTGALTPAAGDAARAALKRSGVSSPIATSAARQYAAEDAADVAAGITDPASQLALWKRRLARAEEVLAKYRVATRYPPESRPLEEHGDQAYPNLPVVEDKKLAKPGDKITPQTVRLRTTQERIFVVGRESVLITATAFDSEGNVLPMIASHAVASDPPQDGIKPSKRPRVIVNFNDAGLNGDVAADDGTLSLQFSPIRQGFADHTGPIRIEVLFKVGESSGFTYFDLYYTPVPPAEWATEPFIREALENGSLHLYLKAEVHRAGRYVITGRIDDARGQPFALAVFNDEKKIGDSEFKLTVFGKLLRDREPAFPLSLRDVDGFLLKADSFPDRELVPRLLNKIYTTKRYQSTQFSDAEWQSEERERHLREFANDVAIARERVDALSLAINTKPGKP